MRCLDVGVAALRLLLEHREHELVLRVEVPVEGPRREPGLGEHLGDGESGRAPLPQHRQARLDERADLVLRPPPLASPPRGPRPAPKPS